MAKKQVETVNFIHLFDIINWVRIFNSLMAKKQVEMVVVNFLHLYDIFICYEQAENF